MRRTTSIDERPHGTIASWAHGGALDAQLLDCGLLGVAQVAQLLLHSGAGRELLAGRPHQQGARFDLASGLEAQLLHVQCRAVGAGEKETTRVHQRGARQALCRVALDALANIRAVRRRRESELRPEEGHPLRENNAQMPFEDKRQPLIFSNMSSFGHQPIKQITCLHRT